VITEHDIEAFSEETHAETHMGPSEMVREFATAMGQPLDNYYDTSAPLWDLRRGLIAEEFKEFIDSFDDIVSDGHNPAHTIKELADLIYVSYGYAVTYGWDLDEAIRRVHNSNMSKLDDNGQPIKRLDGKVIKGPNYKPPHMDDLA
jgi:hypothetical protein